MTLLEPPPLLVEALSTPGDDYERRLEALAHQHHPVRSPLILERADAIGGRLKRYYRRRNPLEVVEQYDTISYARARGLLVFHPRNESALKTERVRGADEGVSPGAPDILIPEPFVIEGVEYFGLALEMKRRRGVPSDVSDAQWWWIEQLLGRRWLAWWCRGAGPAVAAIERCYGGVAWLG